MRTLNKLLVDADAFIALNDGTDANHSQALILWKVVSSKDFQLVTSDPALGEAITVISQNTKLKIAIDFAEATLATNIEIVEVDAKLRKQALNIFKKQTSKNSRFTDCVNMAIMRQEKFDTIFSFDEYYKKNGFKRFGIDTRG